MEIVISSVRVNEVCNDKKLGRVDGGIRVTLISGSWVSSPPCVLKR